MGTCIQHVRPCDLLECLAVTYGDPAADKAGAPTAKPWPATGNHAAGDVWFERVRLSYIAGAFIFSIRGTRVCADFWRAAHDIPQSTFEKITSAIRHGETVYRADAKANMLMAVTARGDAMTLLNRATTWWMTRLSCYEAMPHQPGTINADHCVWDTIYEEEYLPEMAIAGVPGGSLSTWKEGKARALQQFADI